MEKVAKGNSNLPMLERLGRKLRQDAVKSAVRFGAKDARPVIACTVRA